MFHRYIMPFVAYIARIRENTSLLIHIIVMNITYCAVF